MIRQLASSSSLTLRPFSSCPYTQLIVTTHSPQVISTTNAQHVRIIEVNGDHTGVTTPQFQTRGVESASVLAETMKVDPVPRVPEAE